MKGLTVEFSQSVCERLETLDPAATGAWGKMTGREVVPHLIGTFKTSMGQLPPTGFQGNWFTTTLLPPIVFTGLMLPPHNIKTLDREGKTVPAVSEPGDTTKLFSIMQEYIDTEAAAALQCSTHPLFGNIGPHGWSKIHVLHCKHHLKQFGLLKP